MSTIDELHDRLRSLDPSEVQELARRLLGDELRDVQATNMSASTDTPLSIVWAIVRSALQRSIGEGIDSNPEICGGEPRIVRTRIPVWTLVQLHRLGVSDADILKSYPTLRAEDLVHAWVYATWRRAEIDEQIRQHEVA